MNLIMGVFALLLLALMQKLREGLGSDHVDAEDCSKFINLANLKNWKEDEIIEGIRDRFVTGNWSKAASRGQVLEAGSDHDDDDVYGDFEDLETGEQYQSREAGDTGNDAIHKENDSSIEERRLKKLALRAKFDAQYPSTAFYFYFLKTFFLSTYLFIIFLIMACLSSVLHVNNFTGFLFLLICFLFKVNYVKVGCMTLISIYV